MFGLSLNADVLRARHAIFPRKVFRVRHAIRPKPRLPTLPLFLSVLLLGICGLVVKLATLTLIWASFFSNSQKEAKSSRVMSFRVLELWVESWPFYRNLICLSYMFFFHFLRYFRFVFYYHLHRHHHHYLKFAISINVKLNYTGKKWRENLTETTRPPMDVGLPRLKYISYKLVILF